MNILILEDEEVAARNLVRMLQKVAPQATILACLTSIEKARSWLAKHPVPDLIFLDIHLSDGLSFSVFPTSYPAVPVIFTTAFDQYALRAFELNSIDYLVKPFSEQQLAAALEKYHQRAFTAPPNWNQLQHWLQAKPTDYKTRLHVKKGDQILIVPTEKISYFFRDEYVFLYTLKGQRFLIDRSLDQLAAVLDPQQFYRANRQFLVSIQAIQQIETHFNYKLKLHLQPPAPIQVLVAKDRAKAFKDWIG